MKTTGFKGAECWWVMRFLLDELQRNPLVSPPLLEAGRAVESVIGIWAAAGWRLTPAEIQASHDGFNRFAILTADIVDMHTPKRHLFAHIITRLEFHGNPRYYANWMDESLNLLLKATCRFMSQQCFEPCVLSHMNRLLPSKCTRKRNRDPDQ